MNKRSSDSSERDAAQAKKDARIEILLVLGILFLFLNGSVDRLLSAGGEGERPSTLIWNEQGLALAESLGEGTPSTAPPRLTPFFFQPIPINQADQQLLETLPGIGPSLATKIVEYRKNNQLPIKPDNFLDVPGIGPKRAAQLMPLLSFEP